jgi:hypothetical protein
MAIRGSAKFLLYAALAAATEGLCFGQTAPPNTVEVKLTGIVLTNDHNTVCLKTKEEEACGDRGTDWALASGRTTYLLLGDESTLQSFARKRVTIAGVLEQEPVERNGWQMIRRKIAVRSIESSELSEQAVDELVGRLKFFPWRGEPGQQCNRGCWNDFAFTDAMVEILQAGRMAQGALLRHLDDPSIQDQIVMLLGGVGDENVVEPIIEMLADGDDSELDERSRRLNLVGDVALMNLTVDEVLGWGSPCPNTLRTCWSKWWTGHKDRFKEDRIGFRNTSTYPNYGMYEQFTDAYLR